jgi:poly(3-hydroxybutyrate) depolymerase
MRWERALAITTIVSVPWLTGCDSDASSATGTATGSGGGTSSNTATGSGAVGGTTTTSSSTGSSGGGGSMPSSGCDQASPTGVQNLSITVDGEMRTYVLAVPESYDPSTAIPLVFAWHGLGGSGSLARLYFGIEDEAQGGAIFVYPDGLLVQPQNEPGWELAIDGRDVALFDALHMDLSSKYCIDEARIFATGHSFGGYMSNALGCARSTLLRAIAPVAGGGPFGQNCDTGSLSAWLAHGTNDNVVPFAQGEGSRDHWVDHAGCTMTTQPIDPPGCVEYQGCSMERVVWCTHTEGHNWPDLAPAGIWSFFASF